MAALVVPLKKFVTMRRKHELRSPNSWIRDCATKKIPGSFQWDGRGKWFVDLGTYDRVVQKMASWDTNETVFDPALAKLIESLGMSEDDIRSAVQAAQ